jgi:hypothetical protein
MGRLPGLVGPTLLVSTLLAVTLGQPALAQSELVFGEPSASGAFGETITFETTFAATEAPDRVELLVRLPGDQSDRVNIAAVEPRGGDRWRAAVFQGGHTVPNTSYEYRFRAVTEDGSVLGPIAEHRVEDSRIEWQQLSGDRVTVWWHEGDEGFARRALGIAEEAIDSAGEMLGVSEVEPLDFFIYSDSREFRQAMGPSTRENVGGQAHPGIRTLFGLIEPRQIDSDWVEELVVHELAHLVFDEAVRNPYQYPPRWLNEGLAVYLALGYGSADRAQVEGAAGGGTIIPLEGLGGQFPTRSTRIGLAYAESVSAVDYFVESYGEEMLVELITAFADGSGLDAAFLAATGDDFAAFDDAWLGSLGAERPEAYGPRESESGPAPEA